MSPRTADLLCVSPRKLVSISHLLWITGFNVLLHARTIFGWSHISQRFAILSLFFVRLFIDLGCLGFGSRSSYGTASEGCLQESLWCFILLCPFQGRHLPHEDLPSCWWREHSCVDIFPHVLQCSVRGSSFTLVGFFHLIIIPFFCLFLICVFFRKKEAKTKKKSFCLLICFPVVASLCFWSIMLGNENSRREDMKGWDRFIWLTWFHVRFSPHFHFVLCSTVFLLASFFTWWSTFPLICSLPYGLCSFALSLSSHLFSFLRSLLLLSFQQWHFKQSHLFHLTSQNGCGWVTNPWRHVV